ncbi:hypothetical protein ACODT5_04370 [Streptomyces sp. 5.8]|uniref:hypothetical protein n=1 Tax=Streptomyces sp. 5.8 TaxID=3406571 RepID=UPI003BB76B44
MTWVEFPFPACPACSRAWSASRHRDCPAGGRDGGTLDVDPNAARVRCAACRGTWSVWETRFHCGCGLRFEAAEASFRAWLGHLTDALAGTLGAAAGRVVGSLVRTLF